MGTFPSELWRKSTTSCGVPKRQQVEQGTAFPAQCEAPEVRDSSLSGAPGCMIADLHAALKYSSGVNKSATKLLKYLGLNWIAKLPAHLHSAILQVLLQRGAHPQGAFTRRPAGWETPWVMRTETSFVRCVFAAWLKKASKWFKTFRLRYVVLFSVNARADADQATPPSLAPQPHLSRSDSEQDYQHYPQLILVAFRVTESCEGEPASGGVVRAEVSEVFLLNSSHSALCCNVATHRSRFHRAEQILYITGLGGRSLAFGEPDNTELSEGPISPMGETGIQCSPLEELARLINRAAPCCVPPKPSRLNSLLEVFGASASCDGLEEGMVVLTPHTFEHASRCGDPRLTDIYPNRHGSGALGTRQWITKSPARCSVSLSDELVSALLRNSAALCYALLRPFAAALGMCRTSPSPTRSLQFCGGDSKVSEGSELCWESGATNGRENCRTENRGYSGKPVSSCRIGSGLGAVNIRKAWTYSGSCSLRQIVDEHRRAVAADAAMRRFCQDRLVQRERQAVMQQASKALMDDRGHLLPEARLWIDTVDRRLLQACLSRDKPVLYGSSRT